MNFDLTEEQQLLAETLGQLLENECPTTRVREIFDGDAGHDPALWRALAEMGMTGLAVPEQYGGAGLEVLDLAVAAETLGFHATPGPFFGHALASEAIAAGGTDAQKERWLPALAAGEKIGSVAFAEAGGAWQPEQWTLVSGDALSGTKVHVPHAAEADLLVVGVEGGGLAVVEKDAAGIEIKEESGADRTRRLSELVLSGAPAEVLADGAVASLRVRDIALVLLAADAFGVADRLIRDSVEYAKTREQFGVTIGHFQGLKHQLADMAIANEPSRGLYWYAAHARDHVAEEAPRVAAVTKAHITDRTMQIARDAVEAHGGIGFTWECDVQIWFKRAMFDRAWLGTPAVHRERAATLAGW